jgi:hypothetical protein
LNSTGFMRAILSDERYRAGLIIPSILFLSALGPRLYSALAPGIIVPDGIMYINTAKLIDAGEWGKIAQYSFYNLYPFLIAIFHKLIPDWELSARILSVLSGSLAVLPFYWIMKRLFDIRLAVIASIFFSISPRLVEYSSNVIREPVFWFLCLSALSAAVAGMQRKQLTFMILSALCVGLSAFTRMEGLALIPIILFWVFWQYRGERAFTFTSFIVYSLVFLLSFPVLFFTPLIFVKGRLGHWEFGHIGSKIPQILSTGSKPAEQVYERSIEESDAVTKALSGNKYLVFLWQSIFKFFRSYHVLFIFLFIVGITRRKIVPYNPREVLLWSWWLAFFAVSVLYVSRTYYLSTRHGMLMGLPAFLWVAAGFCEIVGMLEKWVTCDKFSIPGWSKNRTAVIAMAVICAVVLPSSLSWSGADKVELKKAGLYLNHMGYSGKKLAVEGRLNRLGFYSGAEYVTIPDNITTPEIPAFLRSAGVDYVIIDMNTMAGSMAPLADDPAHYKLRKISINEFSAYKNYSFRLFSTKRQ